MVADAFFGFSKILKSKLFVHVILVPHSDISNRERFVLFHALMNIAKIGIMLTRA